MTETIFLVGLPGVGKGEVARSIGDLRGCSVVDLDSEVEAAAEMSVEEIFQLEGEAGFRDRESEALLRVIAGSDGGGGEGDGVVIATGGGIVEREVNRTALHAGGTVVWLDAPVEVLVQRLAKDVTTRPLLRTPTALAELAVERKDLYAGIADIRVDATGDPAEVAAATLRALEVT